MIRQLLVLSVCLQSTTFILVHSAKQQLQLSDSYLPVAMQIIAHLTDQMAYEVRDEPSTSKPTSKPTIRPTQSPGGWTTSKPLDQTTPFHRPGLFAPLSPPRPSDLHRIRNKDFMLLPFDHNIQYTFLEPEPPRTNQPFLDIEHEEIKPLVEPAKDSGLLPPNFHADVDKVSRSEDEESEDNLQYLSQNVREMIKMANDPNDDRVVDVWEEVRANKHEVQPKGKLSSSNLRLLLLYDLLSREAKRLRLSDYNGFSPSVMKALADSAGGGARAQLSMALAKMVERRDCEHEYANNRAKEMVAELGKDESKLSSEIRYLQPLVYKQ